MGEIVVRRETCRGCGSSRVDLSLPLAKVPVVSPNVGTGADGGRLHSVIAPLDNYLCRDCGLIQLLHVVDPSLIYRNYLYRTAVSLGLGQHFRTLAEAVARRLALAPGDLVVEFGSNDGTLLGVFKEQGQRVRGVDPARQIAEEASARGIPTRADFFNEAVAREIRAQAGPARAILSNNVLANVDDVGAVLRGVKELLAPSGCFVFETQYALDVFDKFLLDVIYHEHVSCFSVKPVDLMLPRFGLEIVDAERIATKGGSIRIWAQHRGGALARARAVDDLIALEERSGLYDLARHRRLAERVQASKAALHAMIAAEKVEGGDVAGFGTSVGCAALIHQFELEDKLSALYDDKPFKDWIEGPGYSLPIRHGDELDTAPPGLLIILAWRYADDIMRRHRAYLERGGRALVVLPEIRLIEKEVRPS